MSNSAVSLPGYFIKSIAILSAIICVGYYSYRCGYDRGKEDGVYFQMGVLCDTVTAHFKIMKYLLESGAYEQLDPQRARYEYLLIGNFYIGFGYLAEHSPHSVTRSSIYNRELFGDFFAMDPAVAQIAEMTSAFSHVPKLENLMEETRKKVLERVSELSRH